jgi:hypothetical protein
MIGLKGSGSYVFELEILRETERAYLVETEDGEQVWLPKSAFDNGELSRWGRQILINKLEEMLT